MDNDRTKKRELSAAASWSMLGLAIGALALNVALYSAIICKFARIFEQMELEPLTPCTITDKVQLRRELDKIRAQGFAFDDEEAFPGIRCIAAPIREPRGAVVAAISATVPAQRLPTERSPELIEAITETASRVSALIVDSVRED